MEPVITPLLLASTGIDIPDNQVVPLLDYMNNVLEERIGQTVVELLDDDQLQQLAELEETGPEDDVQEWLAIHIPDLPDLIENEVEILLGETAQHQAEFSSSAE